MQIGTQFVILVSRGKRVQEVEVVVDILFLDEVISSSIRFGRWIEDDVSILLSGSGVVLEGH